MPEAMIELVNVTKVFQRDSSTQAYQALAEVNLAVEEGEFVCLLGPSGCGKSTLLNMVAGFERPTTGQVRVEGKDVRRPSTDRGVVFQSEIALFPWLTVEENIAYGPRIAHLGRSLLEDRVEENLHLVGLEQHRSKFPKELSGGMKQRVQIARVLANDPTCLLMDEPFGALDAQTRTNLQHELERIWSRSRKTAVFVTHDISEAIWLADRIAVMSAGPNAMIKSIHRNALPRPRDRMGPQFMELYNALSTDIGHAEAHA